MAYNTKLQAVPNDGMNNKDPIARAMGAVTAQHDFFPVSHQGEALFSVRGGVPLCDAFDQLTVLLTAAQGAVEVLAASGDDDPVPGAHWAAVHALSFANALVQGMHQGHNRHCKSATD